MLPDDVLAASKRFRLSIFQRTIIPGIQTRLLPLKTVMGQMRKLRICTGRPLMAGTWFGEV